MTRSIPAAPIKRQEPGKKKIAVAVQRGVNDDGDQETDETCTQHKSRQLVANPHDAVRRADLSARQSY
jgi:hypothetical protein